MKNIYRVIFIVTLLTMLFINNRNDDVIIFNVSTGNNIRFALLAVSIFSSLVFFTEQLKDVLCNKKQEDNKE